MRAAAFAANRYGAAQLRRSALIGEGGGIEVDGHGTGIMTESSWVNANRNPGLEPGPGGAGAESDARPAQNYLAAGH